MSVMINVGISNEKYLNKCEFHTRDESGIAAEERDPKEIERENKIKEVCLNCTKAKCRGTRKCFEKERDKRNGQG